MSQASDFTNALPFSAFWQYNEGAFSNICATQGRSFVNRLRAVAGLPAGPWDDALQAQMIAAVNGLAAQEPTWTAVAIDLQADAASHTVSPLSLRVGIWLTYYRAAGRRFDAITIQPGTTAPRWGVVPPDDHGYNGGRLVCFDPSVDRDPGLLEDAAIAVATANSMTGVRLEPGRAAPSSTINVVSTGPQTVSALTVIAASVIIVGAAWFVMRGKR